ncbi:GTP-binding protein EngA [hydrothermal vent metagenome]|uniref:GTPase Der n=1 Tax=hydrothermal vent metagenome TaxID=652676 RepID=A0A3B0RGT6_9ZZZZ
MSLRLVIVGRPNVGKSTLFNRLAGRKLAIVHDQPGVTRDRREGHGRFGNLDLALVDTAGFETAKAGMEADMRNQTLEAVAQADICLFIIDARSGLTPLDETFATLLRKSGSKVIIAANKAEGIREWPGVLEGYALGFGEPVAVSAEHNEGMGELFDAIMERAGPEHQDNDTDEPKGEAPLRIAVVGRPNAGKSTLINALVGESRLITGPEAGVTRDSISVDWMWDGRSVRLADTAGMRKKAKVEAGLEKLSVNDSLHAIRFAEVVVVVVDALIAFDKQDLQIADLAEREGRAVVVVVTKWDLIKEKQKKLAALKTSLMYALPQMRGIPMVALSSMSGKGLDMLMPAILQVYKDWNALVKTRDLNDWLQHRVDKHPPPAVQGRRIKPRYLTQTKTRPPTFVLICSRAKHLPESYKRFIVNGLRDDFDLKATPIRLVVKQGKNPYMDGKKPKRNR